MSHQTELIKKLQEIFQIDRADLDFGIYRILNRRSQEIGDYLQNKLPAKIQAAFSASGQTQIDGWKRELAEAEKAAADLGANSADLPKVKELKGKIAVAQKGGAAGEAAVYNHLLTFFSRYYEEGDFISQRRYKGDTYAVPYSGEEVLLHWANKDQYYTKSGENFSNYRFKLSDGREVFFRLTAADTAKDNRKDNDTARVFALVQERVIEKEDDNGDIYEEAVYPVREISDASGDKTLEIRFEYIVAPKDEKKPQEKANENTIAALKALIDEDWQAVWQPAPTEKNPNRTLLEKHLVDYTAKNTADYFIHKDLGGFLRRELDFYIKNEVMDLDNIQDAPTFANIEGSLHQIQTLRAIAREIIDFLAQLEDFQKKLWLKKKFVAKSHWLITLNHIPADMLKTVFANTKQREAWQNLFAINDLPPPDKNPDSFAESNPYLTVDTSLFPASFQTALLAALSNDYDLDEATDGLLIHSDNFQALNLLQARYRGQVKCIYIDPPYNANSSEILYKNTYKHSSWLSLMSNRMLMGRPLLKSNGSQTVAIDEVEQELLGQVLSITFYDWVKACIPIVHNPRGQQGKNISYIHEYFFLLYPNDSTKFIADIKRSEVDSRNLRDSGTESDRTDAKNCFYPFYIQNGKIIGFGEIPDDNFHPSSANIEITSGIINLYSADTNDYKILSFNVTEPVIAVYPMTDDGNEKKWRYSNQSVKSILEKLEPKKTKHNIQIIFNKDTGVMRSLWVDAKYDASEYGTKVLQAILGIEQAKKFSYPKSIHTVKQIIDAQIGTEKNAITLDYFGGSGTTAHAVINLNREDGGRRKYILVEQGEYFDTVLKPRVQKVVYAENWKDGKPQADKESSLHSVPQIVKVLKLESYEDTLNNLVLRDNGDLFNQLNDGVKEDYLLRYMLTDQSRDSLLNTDVFRRPFNYQMDIATNSAGATERMDIDLVETFNYLLGLRVHAVKDRFEKDGYLAVEGTLPDGETSLVLWRDCEKMGYEGLDALLGRLKINPQDSEYDTVYINGDHNIATVWENENGVTGRLKIRQIESEFMALMFGEAQ
jgi:hypothetical protein